MRLLFSIVLAFTATTGCAHSERNVIGTGRCADPIVAREAAVRLLEKDGRAGDFFTDQGRNTDDGGSWAIWIPKREYELPGEALIIVRKSDCSATRMPLK
jgi:hypothetical protein